MEEEEAGEAEVADRLQLLLEPRLGLAPVRRSRRSARRAAPGRARPARGRPPARLRAGSGSRAPCSRSNSSRSARRRVSATASGCSAKRAAIACGEASAEVELPRRRGSDSSSVVPSRTATKASCRRARRRAWRVDVAGGDAGDAEPLGEPGEPAVAAAVAAPVGPLQLDPEAVAAEGAEQAPRQRRAAGAASPRSQAPASSPSPAQPERQTSPSACSSTCSSVTEGCPALRCGLSRVWEWAAVSRRQRLR